MRLHAKTEKTIFFLLLYATLGIKKDSIVAFHQLAPYLIVVQLTTSLLIKNCMNKIKSISMYNRYFSGVLKFLLSGYIFLFSLASPCCAQQLNTDSLLQSSLLYQKGKQNTKVGGILLGTALAGALVGVMMTEKESSQRFQIGPSGKETVFLLSGMFGVIGIFKLIQGGSRIQRARAEISDVSYWRGPGQSQQMPALMLRWPIGQVTKGRPVSSFPVPVCF